MSRAQIDLATHREFVTSRYNNCESADTVVRQVTFKGRKPHICVVGAGVAGLRCADILLQHGVRVTILEGRYRIGGRVSGLILALD